MSLRTRMVLVAGVAVAIAVVARGGRRPTWGRARASRGRWTSRSRALPSAVRRPGAGPPGECPDAGGVGPARAGRAGSGQGSGGTACGQQPDPTRASGFDRPPSQPFGGPSGTFTLVVPERRKRTRRRARSTGSRSARRRREIAKTGQGQYFTDMTVAGHHIRVMATGIGWRGALRWRCHWPRSTASCRTSSCCCS